MNRPDSTDNQNIKVAVRMRSNLKKNDSIELLDQASEKSATLKVLDKRSASKEFTFDCIFHEVLKELIRFNTHRNQRKKFISNFFSQSLKSPCAGLIHLFLHTARQVQVRSFQHL